MHKTQATVDGSITLKKRGGGGSCAGAVIATYVPVSRLSIKHVVIGCLEARRVGGGDWTRGRGLDAQSHC